jgi:hypothetical protein
MESEEWLSVSPVGNWISVEGVLAVVVEKVYLGWKVERGYICLRGNETFKGDTRIEVVLSNLVARNTEAETRRVGLGKMSLHGLEYY